MIRVTFKNLEKSELAKEAALERIETVVDKFPALRECRVSITLEMENSPLQAGPDLFTVKVQIAGGKFSNVRVEKSSPNIYVALADVVEHMLEKLNRHGDRERVRQRNKARRHQQNSVRTEEAV